MPSGHLARLIPLSLPLGGMLALPMDERELLVRLRQGDDAAYEAIFRQWYAPLVAMATALLRDRGPAEEVVQDVMLELWRRRESITFETSLRAYLFQAARNRGLNFL